MCVYARACVYTQTDCILSHHRHPQTVPSLDVVYTEEKGYVTADVAKAEGLHVKKLSGTAFRKMLRSGDSIPEWFAFK